MGVAVYFDFWRTDVKIQYIKECDCHLSRAVVVYGMEPELMPAQEEQVMYQAELLTSFSSIEFVLKSQAPSSSSQLCLQVA